mmetsp:Transcript_12560/g.25698  ORF Transcript_12560/g.25698 Transcript_12560/m.25698 type:complete len:162 (+) Transcript_12560:106-591(+)
MPLLSPTPSYSSDILELHSLLSAHSTSSSSNSFPALITPGQTPSLASSPPSPTHELLNGVSSKLMDYVPHSDLIPPSSFSSTTPSPNGGSGSASPPATTAPLSPDVVLPLLLSLSIFSYPPTASRLLSIRGPDWKANLLASGDGDVKKVLRGVYDDVFRMI